MIIKAKFIVIDDRSRPEILLLEGKVEVNTIADAKYLWEIEQAVNAQCGRVRCHIELREEK